MSLIPPEVKHWHGAAADSWMAHLSIEVPGEECSNKWLELWAMKSTVQFADLLLQ